MRLNVVVALVKRIHAAFAENRYPGDDHLTVYLRRGRKFDETFQLLRGKTWQEMPVDDFISGDTPIPDLTPEAFHYYMPALLLAALDGCSDLAGALTFHFTPSFHEQLARQYEEDEHREVFEKRVALFTAEQRRIIADVLREFAHRGWEDANDVREAVEFLSP